MNGKALKLASYITTYSEAARLRAERSLFVLGSSLSKAFCCSPSSFSIPFCKCLWSKLPFGDLLTIKRNRTKNLFETDPLRLVARSQPFWIVGGISTVIWGYSSTRFRTIREPLFAGFLCFTAAVIGFATIQPNDSTNAIVFAGLAGLGFGAPLILLITGVQLATPYHLIATATAVTTSSRAIAATIFTAVYAAALNNRIGTKLPAYVAKAAAMAVLPPSSIEAFVGALASNDTTALAKIAGVTPAIIGAGVAALKQAFADSVRVVYMIAAPFGALACIACFFLGDMRKKMDYRVDAPIEELHAKAAVSKA